MPNERETKFKAAFEYLNNAASDDLSELMKGAGLDPKEDLAFADASEANLSGQDYSNANLEGCLLTSANLERANLSGANLEHADLSGANLRYADLANASLRFANLSRADLSHASLRGADITGADLSDVIGEGVDNAVVTISKVQPVINAPSSRSWYEVQGYEGRDVYGMYKQYRDKGSAPRFMGADTLLGENVYNHKDEDLGNIKDIMLDMNNGTVTYAVLSFRGFLGMGDKLFAVPWNALTLDTVNKRFILNVDKERLEYAPGFDKDHWPDMADPTWENTVHSFYGTTPDSDHTPYTDTSSDYAWDYTGRKKPSLADTKTQSNFMGDKPKR